jgi:DNA-dependent RNA polymerase auxiliary subunit epsilon
MFYVTKKERFPQRKKTRIVCSPTANREYTGFREREKKPVRNSIKNLYTKLLMNFLVKK